MASAVGTHDRPRLRPLHDTLKGRQVHLAQCALVDDNVDIEPLGFLIIDGEMLERGADAFALNPFNPGRGQFAGKIRIFRKVFEVATAQRRALHVDTRSQQDVDAKGDRLLGQRLPRVMQQVGVPRGGQQRGRGEVRFAF